MALEFRLNTSTVCVISAHLVECDAAFDPPLSSRVDLHQYAEKLVTRAVRFEAWSEGAVVGLVAAYCNDQVAREAFVTSVSVSPAWLGKGVASRLMRDCLAYAVSVGMRQMTLEVSKANTRAVGLYTRLGFVSEPESKGPFLVMRARLPPQPA